MERHFDTALRELKERLIEMGSLAEQMIGLAVQGLVQRTDKYNQQIFDSEKRVNQLQIEIDETAIRLMALQHPVAHDLRFLVMATKIAGELERVADLAINTCQSAQFLLQDPTVQLPAQLPVMANIARQMLRDALDALVREDITLARKVLHDDDIVDAYKKQILQQSIELMEKERETVNVGVSFILISRSVERVGDYATNIAEEVIYLAQGREVRHHWEDRQK